MEFTRETIVLLQQIRRLARQECGCVIHYDSPNLEQELRALSAQAVSAELAALLEELLPVAAATPAERPPERPEEPAERLQPDHLYRGHAVVVEERAAPQPLQERIYRGRTVLG